MRSREVGREAAMLQIRDQLSARQDDIQAMVSRLSGTVDYLGMVRRVRADMRRLLPPAARVIVISKGDPDLLDVEGQHAWHFPQDEQGDYAGHYPAESGEAIAHLEALRARGGRFLVIPSSAFWWLEHYAGLAHHLDTNYQKIWKSADCQIYELEGRIGRTAPSMERPPSPSRVLSPSSWRTGRAIDPGDGQMVRPIASRGRWIALAAGDEPPAVDHSDAGPTRPGARLHPGDLRHARAGSGEHRSRTSAGQGLGLVEGRHRGRQGLRRRPSPGGGRVRHCALRRRGGASRVPECPPLRLRRQDRPRGAGGRRALPGRSRPEPRRLRDGAEPLVPTRPRCQARSKGSQCGIPGLAGPADPVRVGPGPDADRRG